MHVVFIDWINWLRFELGSFLFGGPVDLARRKANLIVTASQDEVFVKPKNKRSNPITLAKFAEGGASIPWFKKRAVLELSATSMGLERGLATFNMPVRQAAEMAVLDLSSSTPIAPESVHILLPVTNRDNRQSSYLAIKKQRIRVLVDRLSEAGIKPIAITANGRQGCYWADKSVLAEVEASRFLDSLRGRVARFGCILVAGLFLGTAGHAYWRYDAATREVNAQIEDARLVIAKISKRNLAHSERIQKLDTVRREKRNRAPLVAVWEELSRVIPDSAWVTDVTVTRDSLTFSGFARSASGLIAGLDASKMFEEPALYGRVLRDPKSGAERYSIRTRLGE